MEGDGGGRSCKSSLNERDLSGNFWKSQKSRGMRMDMNLQFMTQELDWLVMNLYLCPSLLVVHSVLWFQVVKGQRMQRTKDTCASETFFLYSLEKLSQHYDRWWFTSRCSLLHIYFQSNCCIEHWWTSIEWSCLEFKYQILNIEVYFCPFSV